MKAQWRTAVLGAGAIAEHHLNAIRLTEGFTACAIADIDVGRAKLIAAKYGIAGYTDYRELIDREKPDVVTIALPHFLHAEAAVHAAERGCHLMLEKPMALSTAECDRILVAGRKQGVRIVVGHTQHYMKENLAAKRILQSGELGELVMIHDVRHADYFHESRPRWFLDRASSGGGILANLGSHSIDKIQWLTERAVRQVKASVSHHTAYNVEGSGAVYLELEGGIPAMIVQSGYRGARRNETEIIGTQGMLRLRTGDSLWKSVGGPYERVDIPNESDPFLLQYAELSEAILADDESMASPLYGRSIVAVLEAIYRAAREGREVRV
ncbi:Gfo/Idh/MocA family oxidoreductase [Paenibacillus sp. IB182496]|uniref:Gfo/Idh/MocA family oxidoreductase n=1 Tax=Paenibacillus sabuli TaxID=2772509 RepID=A0A927GQ99_9BACL|nr:Gfo/Idh/MocA family oxidoreductase [Paenibacillus sabuli]MBD2844304.1 Gfo/Idh/MocA family oxidoreductase [Paenibacillus sabuli]